MGREKLIVVPLRRCLVVDLALHYYSLWIPLCLTPLLRKVSLHLACFMYEKRPMCSKVCAGVSVDFATSVIRRWVPLNSYHSQGQGQGNNLHMVPLREAPE